MYDFPHLREAHDALWSALAETLTANGVTEAPTHLTRSLDHRNVWRHPSLLFGQACEYPIAKSLGSDLTLVATPRYSAPGCEGSLYRSAIIVRAEDSADSIVDLRDRRCVVNEPDSNSGMNLHRAAVAPLGATPFFQSVRLSGSHRRSVEIVAANEADVTAVDCVTFAHLRTADPALTAAVRILCWTPASPSLPFVTARATSHAKLKVLRSALAAVIRDTTLREAREVLLLEGVDLTPDASLSSVLKLERDAAELQYPELR
jgi:ABC-type phosphate/phosphonate transport system substrate-binding protein